MRRRSVLVLALAGLVAANAFAAGLPAIVPNPAEVELHAGEFAVSAATPVIASSSGARAAASRLASLAGTFQGVKLAVREGNEGNGAVTLRLDPGAPLGAEGYRIDAGPKRVTIVAATPAGLSHGATTLAQLMSVDSGRLAIPALAMIDRPRFPWRGI